LETPWVASLEHSLGKLSALASATGPVILLVKQSVHLLVTLLAGLLVI
jgi:hypothetical protein